MNDRFDFVCDCHNDSILRIGCGEYGSLISPYNVSSKHKFLQIFAIFNENGSGLCEEGVAENFGIDKKDLYGAVLRFCDIYADTKYGSFARCLSYDDVGKAALKGENCGMLAVEGAGMVDTLEKLHVLHEKQVRFITLTWNFSNCIASGCAVTGTDNDKGLTDYGREFVKECGRLGIAVDLSHASVNTMRDVLETAEGPVFATHSNFRAVCDHVRNLPDDVAEGIVEKGGFIGLNTYLPFVRRGIGFDQYDPDMLFDHIDHAIKKGFDKNLGFGFDIDGVEAYAKGITFERSIHDQYLDLKGFNEKYDAETVYGIRCGNFLRFLRDNY